MKELVLMMGVPGSGKSTYAHNIIKTGDIYISRDEIRYSMLAEDDDYFAKENVKLVVENKKAGFAEPAFFDFPVRAYLE